MSRTVQLPRRPSNHDINCLRTACLRRANAWTPSVRPSDLSSTVETRARLAKDYGIPLWAPDTVENCQSGEFLRRVAAWESVNKTKG
ncbi:hypothetical protein NEUTE2DRAFT_124182 [Neurospora tetrasperma FGSC 2509]|nr:hypothetical protein NEUTE2DRAFT_124182 [Neurospora tetrasperma FGSC 2509]